MQEQLHFTKDQTVATPQTPHSHYVSPAVTLTNSVPLCTHCTGLIVFSATNPFFLSIT